MKGHNFLWAVKQMLNGKRVTRENGFSNVEIKYTLNIMGSILCCRPDKSNKLNDYVLDMTGVWLKTNDYLAKDWILWEK